MRRIPLLFLVVAPLLVLAASARPALAQEKGRFVVDGFVAPEPGLGFGYYVTDRLAVHPSIGFGHSSLSGTFYSVGGVLRFYLRPQHAVEPYVLAQADYLHNQAVPVDGSDRYQDVQIESHGARLGLGGGVRWGLNRRLALFSEARVVHSTSGRRFDSGTGDWGRVRLTDQGHLAFGVGMTFTLNPRRSASPTSPGDGEALRTYR